MIDQVRYKRAIEFHINGETEDALGELALISKKDQKWAKPLLFSRFHAQEKQFDQSMACVLNTDTSGIVSQALKHYVSAEICNQKAQIGRHNDFKTAATDFTEAAEKYKMGGDPHSALMAEFNSLACRDNYLVGPQRVRLWKGLHKKSQAYPNISSNIKIYLGLFARERGQAKAYLLLEEAFVCSGQQKQLQNRIVSQLIAAEVAFFRGDLPILSSIRLRLIDLFESNSILWLTNRFVLTEVRWLILCGQLAKAKYHLDYFFRQSSLRPIDEWNGHTLSLILDQRRGKSSKTLFLEESRLTEGLTAFELCHRDVLIAQKTGLRRQLLKAADLCMDSQFEALLPEQDLLPRNSKDLQIFPIERKINFKGTTKAFRSNARSFDLLLALVQNSDHIFGKVELIERVWQRSQYDSLTDNNVIYVNINTLRKYFGTDCILSIGGGFKWNANRPFTIFSLPA